jgi:putative spermidine/putrescine transport system ATP-binding protein
MTSTTLTLNSVSRRFRDTVALDSLDLKVSQGELVSLLGPSGCGKTTALRIIAGLEKPDSGEIFVGDRNVSQLPPNKRNMGMVFQSYSLFPNLTAAENVAFGLTMRKENKRVKQNKSLELLELVGLSNHAKRFPHQLSGGQQQRVALARALALEPDVLLLDEPLSALDAQVRANLRDEIRALQIKTGTTTIFVTHDQEEAMSMSDRVAVMHQGKISQIARPDELYHQPANQFVASFVGQMNRLPASIDGQSLRIIGSSARIHSASEVKTGAGFALVRPENISIQGAKTSRTKSNAIVISRSFLGPMSKIVLRLEDGTEIASVMASNLCSEFASGDSVRALVSSGEYLVVAN